MRFADDADYGVVFDRAIMPTSHFTSGRQHVYLLVSAVSGVGHDQPAESPGHDVVDSGCRTAWPRLRSASRSDRPIDYRAPRRL